jgi:hypothetical protein
VCNKNLFWGRDLFKTLQLKSGYEVVAGAHNSRYLHLDFVKLKVLSSTKDAD